MLSTSFFLQNCHNNQINICKLEIWCSRLFYKCNYGQCIGENLKYNMWVQVEIWNIWVWVKKIVIWWILMMTWEQEVESQRNKTENLGLLVISTTLYNNLGPHFLVSHENSKFWITWLSIAQFVYFWGKCVYFSIFEW